VGRALGQWECSDREARIADVAGSEACVFLLRGGGWRSGAESRRGVVGWMMLKASFSPALFFFFLSQVFLFEHEILLILYYWAHAYSGFG